MTTLVTERLILRELRQSDVDSLFELDSNPQVHRYLGNKPILKIEQVEEIITNIRKQYVDYGVVRWATIEKSSGKFIGWSGLKYITDSWNNKRNFHDVGYRFIPKYWGKGYATESTKAALEYAFNTLELNEVFGTCHEKNIASRRVLEKCGLKYIEKFIYINEITCDWLKISKEEWGNKES